MDVALVYHYWNNTHADVSKDFRVPVLLSIATFRNWDRDTPIYVVDVSDQERQWGDFPSFLNFKVVRTECHLKYVVKADNEWSPVRLLSKPKDIFNFSLTMPQQVILCVDADYFFLGNPCPITHSEKERPSIGWNTGYWRYNKNCPLTTTVFDLWKSSCANVLLDDVFRDKVMRESGRTYLNDETVMNYLLKTHAGICNFPSIYDNVIFESLVKRDLDVAKIKGLHIIHSSFRIARGKRGLACLWIRELREIVGSVLGPRMKDIFGEEDTPSGHTRHGFSRF